MNPWILLAAGPVAAATLTLVVLRRRFVVVRVAETSMAPALQPGDRVLIRRGAGGMVRVGRIVVFGQPIDECDAHSDAAPVSGTRWMIKRVAAAGGDAVPDEARLAVSGATVVPPGMLVVLGDNHASADSRTWGFLPAAAVHGVAVRLKPSGSAPEI
jgi:signal peptidase I